MSRARNAWVDLSAVVVDWLFQLWRHRDWLTPFDTED